MGKSKLKSNLQYLMEKEPITILCYKTGMMLSIGTINTKNVKALKMGLNNLITYNHTNLRVYSKNENLKRYMEQYIQKVYKYNK